MASIYSPQGRATTGRKTFNPVGIRRQPYYPQQPEVEAVEETPPPRQYEYGSGYEIMGQPDLQGGYYGGITKNDMIAAQEEGYYENIEREARGEPPLTEMEIHQGYIDKYKIPDDTLSRLRKERTANLPAGDMDISQGIPEGVSDPSGMPGGSSLQKGGQAFAKGEYGKGFANTAKGLVEFSSAPVLAPMMAINKAIEPVKDWAVQKVKGLVSSDTPNLGSAVPSGSGVSPLSGPMAWGHTMDLADLDVGDGFGDGIGPPGGMGHGPAGDGGFGEGPGW